MGVAEWTPEHAHEHERAQGLTMDLLKIAGERVVIFGVSKICAIALADQGKVGVVIEGG